MTERAVGTEAQARDLLHEVATQRRRARWTVRDGFVEFTALQVAFVGAKLLTGDHRVAENVGFGVAIVWVGAFALWGLVAYLRRSALGVGLPPQFVPVWALTFVSMLVAGQVLHGDARYGATAGVLFVATAYLAVKLRSLILASLGLWVPLLALARAAGWADWLVLAAIVPWAATLYVTRRWFRE